MRVLEQARWGALTGGSSQSPPANIMMSLRLGGEPKLNKNALHGLAMKRVKGNSSNLGLTSCL